MIFRFVVAFAVIANVAANFNAKAFQSSNDYPKPSDFPEVDLLKSKPNTAIAATGGGSRAYTAFLGYMAGLNELGLMGNVRYIGGISGGAWATTTYSYAQNTDDDKVLLGPVTNPEDLTLDNLKGMDPNCARGFAAANLTLIGLNAWIDGTVHSMADAWVYGVSKTYLEPAGIMPNKYYSLNDKTVQDIIAQNPQLKPSDFTTVANENRPFPIIGTALIGPAAGAPYTKATQNYSMLDITPLYIGQMRTQAVEFKYHRGLVHKRTVGGMIEPFAFTNAGTGPKLDLLIVIPLVCSLFLSLQRKWILQRVLRPAVMLRAHLWKLSSLLTWPILLECTLTTGHRPNYSHHQKILFSQMEVATRIFP